MQNQPTSFAVKPASRREFLRKTVAAATAAAAAPLLRTPVYGQNQAPSANVLGANNRLVVGFIGTGNMGQTHIRTQKAQANVNNIALAAVCDVSKYRAAQAKALIGDDVTVYHDYRKLLERKDIDAVTIATVDHWHARCTVDALNAGKHVYVEKPMTRYLGEAFEVYDTVKKTGKILQVGSQGCSDLKWHKAAEWIREGKIGPVVMAQGSYMRNNPKGEWNYTIESWATPEDIDWQLWLGPVHRKKPFSADDYFRWRKYYPYCGGLLSDLVPHKAHPYMLATGNPQFPIRVACVGSKPVGTDKNTQGTPPRDVPEIVQIIAEFPDGMVMHITSSSVNEQGTQEMIRGHMATLTMAGNRVELRPERPFADEIDPETSEPFPVESVEAHEKNWFDCIRANKEPNCGIELAIRVQTIVSLAEISERLNVLCLFDPKTRKVTTGDGRPVPLPTYGWSELS
ncbi:MAG: Gfo/Idh/MocA family oxidoreductase [Verrucomicrobiota bacterium]|nr:Gfo/Idh/MocA family oxidoreductase [Limisphaera sp.]MDW8381321.1 Gfo/Idh/MocA family oxidoreductase [Verrucomicrobiota bacterium]